MEFSNYTLSDFLQELSSSNPTPGGGSVAGLIGALAGSLNSMVYSLTLNKKSFQNLDLDIQKKILDFSEASEKFVKKSLNLMEADKANFKKLIESYKLPKDTEEQSKIRSSKIKEGTLLALKAPLEMAKEAYKFYNNIDIAIEYGNKMLISDAKCAAILLNSCIECSIINVKVNLDGLKESEFVTKTENELKELLSNSNLRKNKIANL